MNFLFLIILFHFHITNIPITFIGLTNLFTDFQIVFATGLGLNRFLFLCNLGFIVCSKDLIKKAAG